MTPSILNLWQEWESRTRKTTELNLFSDGSGTLSDHRMDVVLDFDDLEELARFFTYDAV